MDERTNGRANEQGSWWMDGLLSTGLKEQMVTDQYDECMQISMRGTHRSRGWSQG